MLISKNKGVSPGDIVGFRITTGDEIVAKIVEINDKGFVLSKPCMVIPSERGIGLMQYLISADINNNVTLKNEHIIMHSPIIPDIERHYIRTTSGITLV